MIPQPNLLAEPSIPRQRNVRAGRRQRHSHAAGHPRESSHGLEREEAFFLPLLVASTMLQCDVETVSTKTKLCYGLLPNLLRAAFGPSSGTKR